MSAIDPKEAAVLADAVYGIRTLEKKHTADQIIQGVKERVPGNFAIISRTWDFEAAKVAHSASGFTNATPSGFAMAVPGKGERQGQTAMLFRGTQTTADWCSNFTLGLSNGPSGLQVHTGFNRIYQILKSTMLSSVSKQKGNIHIIGHSLGGALANLMAAELAGSLDKQPKLYTFGAPRVGLSAFSQALEKWVNSDSIYRVYDIADPVPMVPIFPFVHAPVTKPGLKVGVGGGAVNIPSHFMSSYIPRLEGKSWSMVEASELKSTNLRDIDALLSKASQNVRIPGASTGLWILGKVLQSLIDVAYLVASPITTLSFTALDSLASLLSHVGNATKKLGSRILKFMEMVFSWLGKNVAKTSIELTTAFIRYVLNLLLTPIAMVARSALERIN